MRTIVREFKSCFEYVYSKPYEALIDACVVVMIFGELYMLLHL